MKIEQIYTGCLAQGAYYIQSAGEGAIIDPLREVSSYIEKANKGGVKIKYIFETHFHADFVSGHVTLAEKTGADIVYGPTAEPEFDAIIAEDGQVFEIGDITITVLHTPGHTMESSTFLLKDENGKEVAIFSGDTLFLGDVGRPDLAQKAADMTEKELAGILYDSLRTKIMPLSDDITVYPGHGAGSACGKNMMDETVDTLGNQKKTNYALRADMTKEEFIEEVTAGLAPPPGYFPENVRLNKEGYSSIDTVLETSLKALSAEEFENVANEVDPLILDVRHQSEFVKGHIPNSIFIGLDDNFAPWVGELIVDVKQPILLIAPKGREEEAVTRLARIGFDHTIGYLAGGFETWQQSNKEVSKMKSISANRFAEVFNDYETATFDVRKPDEYTAQHVEGAKNTPLTNLNDFLDEFSKDNEFAIHCAGGYRSVIAGSILKSRGIHNLVNIEGGFKEIENTDIPTTEPICPSSL